MKKLILILILTFAGFTNAQVEIIEKSDQLKYEFFKKIIGASEYNTKRIEAQQKDLDALRTENTSLKLLITKLPALEAQIEALKQLIENLDTDPGTGDIDGNLPEGLAFPGAYGAGAYTTGGRGGEILHVTNLLWNDSKGSLKWAIEQDYEKYIVFDVSGEIDVSDIGLYYKGKGNVTIAGQTAPKGGVTIRGESIGFYGENNIIIRYLKFRKPGDKPVYDWCLNVANATDVIIDHCSFSFSEEFALGVGTTSDNFGGNVTIQNNLFAECKDAVLVGNSTNKNIKQGSYSVLNNMYVNVGWRAPVKLGGALQIDVINNAAHNWWWRTIRADRDDYTLNIIGNYFQPGVNTKDLANPQTMFTTHTSTTMKPKIWDEDNTWAVFNAGSAGEYDPAPKNYLQNKSLAWHPFADSTAPINLDWFVKERLPLQGRAINIVPSTSLKTHLLDKVGATVYIDDNGQFNTYIDPLDTNFLDDFKDEVSVNYTANWSKPLPNMATSTRPSNFYISNPHIPEAYLKKRGITGNAEIHNKIMKSGHSLFEEYINGN